MSDFSNILLASKEPVAKALKTISSTRIASTRRFSKCMIASRCSAAKEPVPVFYHCRGRRKSRTQSVGINKWNPRQQMRHDHPTLEKQPVTE
jgi:hypothetical protein